jgi:hypothetical protein
VVVPVYYLGESERGPVLYREFRAESVGEDTAAARARAALAIMLTRGSAADPDYATYWPAGVSVRDASVDANTVTVDLAGVPAAATADAAHAARSVDQLVYTATGASNTDRVRLRLDGQPVSRLWGVDAGARRPAVDVQAPLWLIEPAYGGTAGPQLHVHVAGVVFENTARLRVRNAAGTVVVDRMIMLTGAAPQVGEVRLDLTLDPGRYTVEVYALSAKDGHEQFADDHEVTIG